MKKGGLTVLFLFPLSPATVFKIEAIHNWLFAFFLSVTVQI